MFYNTNTSYHWFWVQIIDFFLLEHVCSFQSLSFLGYCDGAYTGWFASEIFRWKNVNLFSFYLQINQKMFFFFLLFFLHGITGWSVFLQKLKIFIAQIIVQELLWVERQRRLQWRYVFNLLDPAHHQVAWLRWLFKCIFSCSSSGCLITIIV